MDATETDDESIVGEAAHIVAEKEDGPRGKSELSREERDKYSNLLLLCNVHHKQIDDQTQHFTVEKLYQIKRNHEDWVQSQLNIDSDKLREDLIYASYVEEWERAVALDEWNGWGSSVLSGGQPSIREERKIALEEVRTWLLSRVWPGRYPELESAFYNFRHVAQDFCLVFERHMERVWGHSLQVRKFYKIERWDPELYHRLGREYEEHVSLVEDLFLELTRATNYVCDMVRKNLMHSYRMKEGVLLVTSGPYGALQYITHRVEYRGDERHANPYKGLQDFSKDRFSRDYSFGDPPEDSQTDGTA